MQLALMRPSIRHSATTPLVNPLPLADLVPGEFAHRLEDSFPNRIAVTVVIGQ